MDYNSLKVTELKDELKRRGIPTTKLTRKQDIIDRLVEHDAEKSTEGVDNEATQAEPIDPAQPADGVDSAQEDNQARGSDAPDQQLVNQAETQATLVTEPSAPPPVQPAQLSDGAAESAPQLTEIATNLEAAPNPQPATSTPGTPSKAPSGTDTPDSSKKRKRRSATPPVTQDSVAKKLKQAQDDVVHIEKDEAIGEAPLPVNGEAGQAQETVLPMASSDDVMHVDAPETAQGEKTPEQINTAAEKQDVEADIEKPPASPRLSRSPNERRFKELIPSSTSKAQAHTNDEQNMDIDPSVPPALHPATPAIYIRNLIRPINPSQLQSHLLSLADPSGDTADANIIKALHVDALRTHAFVLFTSTTLASRTRTSLHSRIWPPEPTRKPLWVDFIPEDLVEEWISTEQASSGSRPSQAKKWEVQYTDTPRGMNVSLVEATSGTLAPPLGPRGSTSQTQQRAHPTDHERNENTRAPSRSTENTILQSAPFLELDTLFESTTTKPKLYYQPVSQTLQSARREEMKAATSRDWDARADQERNRGMGVNGRGALDQLRRYTFEDGDLLVDSGPEFGGGRAFGGRGGWRGGDRYRG